MCERMSEVMRALGLFELRLKRLDSADMSALTLKRVALAAALLLPRPKGNEVTAAVELVLYSGN